MRKLILNIKVLPALVFGLTVPVLVSAVGWQPLVVCGDTVATMCNWDSLILFARNVINDLIILALPVAAIAFAWAGFQILTSGGDEGKMKKGKDVLFKVAIGFAWIVGAYVLVQFIIKTFVDARYFTNLL